MQAIVVAQRSELISAISPATTTTMKMKTGTDVNDNNYLQ